MKKLVSLCSLLLLMVLGFSASLYAQAGKKADKDTKNWRYEIEGMGVGTQGTYLLKVWSYSKKPVVAIEQAKKNAVHGVVFKGFPGKQGMPGQKPLVTDPTVEIERTKFFNSFFADNGDFMNFVTLSGDGSVAAEDRLKVGKEYKIGVIVSVNVSSLRKYLEEAAVIKGLGAGF